MAKSSVEQVKEDELKILASLQEYSKDNIDKIAKSCGFSKQKVWRYIKRFEESQLIWGSHIVVDEHKLKREKFLLVMKRSLKQPDKKMIEQVVSRNDPISKKQNILIQNAYYLHGEYDWALIFTATDLAHAKTFCNGLMQEYPGIFTKFDLIQVLYTEREQFVLNPDATELSKFL